ncbi:MAG TPA: hypothetical protein VFS00_29240, partial [Polyangiaceae bacterium]|nr:hypothetical protein [Polyangiaceae bacterium]
DRAGACRLGAPTEQRCDERGAWVDSRVAPAGALADAERRALADAGAKAAEALHRAGYFGPFNLDAFRWRGPDGAPRFNPRCEINARYSMGWAVGMGARTLGDFAREDAPLTRTRTERPRAHARSAISREGAP